ncbi:MAG: phosphatase PAP2 family protein [Elusimicrobia bacterium]|nr:phosphatase PAP2 family protein [Elusimicrobiota bacterium]
MLKKSFLTLFFLLICGSLLLAQEKYDFSQVLDETNEFIKQPAKWRGNDYIKLGVITAGTILVMQADKQIRDEVLKDRRYDNSFVIEGGRMWGEWYSAPLLAGAFALHGWINKNNSSKKIGFELIQAAIYSSAITQVVKISIGRARPYMNEGAFSYKPFNLNSDYSSLPSGHTANAFAVSTVLSKNIDNSFWKAAVYLPAACTAVSRVYEDQHWASDCFLGAAIGYLCGSWVVDHHDQKESSVKISSIYPLVVSIEF